MIEKLFNEQTVAVDVQVKDWVEAIKFGGNLLVESDAVETEYIDAMIENVKKMGQYIVIAPGLAMPHARTWCEKNCYGFTKTKNTCSFWS